MSEDSHLVVRDGKVVVYAGHDAMRAVRAIAIANALRFWAKTGMKMTRGVGINMLLLMAKQFTGKTYKRSQAMQAADDVQAWADLMKASLPVVEG